MNLKFYILPGNPPADFQHVELYNDNYQYFKNTWQRLFNRPNRPAHYDAMAFFKQTFILCICDGETVVSQLCGTTYSLDRKITLDLKYFQNFMGDGEQTLRELNCRKLLSLEFCSLARDYSPKHTSWVSLSEVISHLGVRMAKTLEVDAVLGTPRRVTQTNTVIGRSGYRLIETSRVSHGVSVDTFIGIPAELLDHENTVARQLVEQLWTNRLDTFGISHTTPTGDRSISLEQNKLSENAA